MDNIMKYKGYWAEIKYCDEDECLYGVIEGLKNISISLLYVKNKMNNQRTVQRFFKCKVRS